MKNLFKHVLFALLFVCTASSFAQDKIKIACVGNSITFANVFYNRSYPQVLDSIIKSKYGNICDVRNYGNPGKRVLQYETDGSYMAQSSYTDALAFNPDICFISLGTNDSYAGVWEAHSGEFFDDYKVMINTFKARNPNMTFVLCYPTPIVNTTFGYTDAAIVNGVIPEIAKVIADTKNAYLLDWHTLMAPYGSYFPDNIHPNPEGSVIMGQFAYEKLLNTDLLTSFNSTTNLAAGKAVTVSSTVNNNNGSAAVDGNIQTRWESSYSDPQWMYVDLGVKSNIGAVRIFWEGAYGKDYQIQVSDDATNWTTIKTVTGNSTLYNNHTGLSGSGRYVRIYGTARGTMWGYSIRELKVYGPTVYTNDITNFSGTVTTQYSDSPSGEDKSKLTDNNAYTKYLTFHNSAWMQYSNSNSYIVTSYSMTSANDAPDRDPLNWTLQGSNNGSNWTTIDTRSNKDFPNRHQTRTFSFSNSTAYSYYRFNLTNNTGTILQVAEIQLFGIANSIVSGATYRLVNANSGKVLDVYGASLDNGANVQQYTSFNSTNQQWVINSLGNTGYYRITAAHSGKALEVADASTGYGANIQQNAYNSLTHQQWSIVNVGGGYYEIINRNSGKAMEVYGASTNDGGNVSQWDYYGQNNQKWQLVQVMGVRSAEAASSMQETPSELSIYPNPVSSVLYLQGVSEDANMVVYNSMGVKVIETVGKNIQVDDLAAGTYVLKIRSEYGLSTKLFLKK